jgi:translation initiation factor IF-3
VIVFRGREIVHPETGHAMLDQVVKAVNDVAMVEQRPMMEGRRMVMTVGPRGGVIRPPLVVGPGSSSIGSIGSVAPSRPVESTGGVTPIAAGSPRQQAPAAAPGQAPAPTPAAAAPLAAVPSAKAPAQTGGPAPAQTGGPAPAATPKQTAATKA